MTWRTIILEKGGKLSLKQQQLLIAQERQQFTVPLEDIAIIIIESPETVITAPLLSQLAIHQISLITCDEQHLPCGAIW
ncbi:CRISPR-associated endonuclease Cas1 [Actinobacillus delphinicola]|uniref:CRISPR-associated endonuclease Cas1 n=1 Tax=Actinobacillus delphinicola TaxID=51161 RepID=UPI00311F5FB5